MKTITTIAIDAELLAFVRKNQINLSGFVNDAIKTMSKEDVEAIQKVTTVSELDNKIAEFSSKAASLMEQKKQLEAEMEKEAQQKELMAKRFKGYVD